MRFAKLLLPLLLGWSGLALAVPQIQHWQTGNGARVYFVATRQLPMVDVRVMFDAGSARDGAHPGVAALTADMIAQGAGKLDADTIADRFDAVGAHFGTDAARDSAVVSLRSLTDPELLHPALQTLAQILSDPTFPAKALARERNRTLIGLQAEQQDPGAVAEKAFFKALYGDHPYAHSPQGTPASVRALSRADLRAFYKRYYVGRNAVVAIVGDLSRAQAERLAETLVGTLPAGAAAPALPPVPPLHQARDVHIPQTAAQTQVLMGQPVVRRGDPDYFALYVGNHILGGSGLVSRIADEVREKRGLAYSAYSYFIPMRQAGPFQLGLQTKTSTTHEALTVLRATLKQFLADGPTAKELEDAKRNITGGFPLNIDSDRKLVGYLAMIGFYRLPLDYLDRFNSRVEAVTLAQIRDAFRRRVDPDHMVTVTVGDGTT